MNKKFLSVILFSALMAGTAGTFTSCKDYDDDIKDLQGQLDKKASLDELNSKVSTLETSIAEAKTEASNAKTAAQEALDKAGQGGASSEDIAALKKALEDADAALQKQNRQVGFSGCCRQKDCRSEGRITERFHLRCRFEGTRN